MSRGRGGFRGGKGRGNNNGLDIPDDLKLKLNFIEAPTYPEMEIPPFRQLDQNEEHILEIEQRINKFMKESPFYLEPDPPAPDMEFFPEELHVAFTGTNKRRRSVKYADIDLSKLDDIEKDDKKEQDNDNQEADEDEDEPDEFEDEEEDDNDYVIDHYDDEMDAIGNEDDGDY
ncbi:hypothetical protein HDV01_002502 [Terramyces sp. JEL0728]|nr:hypothetical protein HDV01_002502 [Terramyces sp. JEL0728]